MQMKEEGGLMKKKATALDIANWFLWYNNEQQLEQLQEENDYDVYEGLTHLKIQKLLYYAEGVYSAITSEDLFDEKIYAWQHGPVVQEVYAELSRYGRKEIFFSSENWQTIKEMNEDTKLYNILRIVYENFAGYTAWQLRQMTHVAGGPWQITVDSKGLKSEIDKKEIREYFFKNIVS